jgi:hypothetical protein
MSRVKNRWKEDVESIIIAAAIKVTGDGLDDHGLSPCRGIDIFLFTIIYRVAWGHCPISWVQRIISQLLENAFDHSLPFSSEVWQVSHYACMV